MFSHFILNLCNYNRFSKKKSLWLSVNYIILIQIYPRLMWKRIYQKSWFKKWTFQANYRNSSQRDIKKPKIYTEIKRQLRNFIRAKKDERYQCFNYNNPLLAVSSLDVWANISVILTWIWPTDQLTNRQSRS